MIRKVFGWLLFGWMTIAVVGGGSEAFKHARSGTPFWTNVAACVCCAALAGIGLTMALGKTQPPAQPPQN